ncbi:hypothetical protein [uncultured Bacteroides sp.]|uniref:hypothetical protein n=1 Tax=uncultured Bacteroides sp. TaxID=162156 RepID=UPI002AA6E602|nr:hypothetical protein [uncultured Bacteroides sp.]
MLKALRLLTKRILIINDREELLVELVRMYDVNKSLNENVNFRDFVERLHLLFDFRNKRAPERSIDTQSIETQMRRLRHEMNEEEED